MSRKSARILSRKRTRADEPGLALVHYVTTYLTTFSSRQLALWENDTPHKLHPNGLYSVWVRIWVSNSATSENLASHKTHACGACFFMCIFKSFSLENLALHESHACGCCSVWLIIYRTRWSFCEHLYSHDLQTKGFLKIAISPEWIIMCFLMYSWENLIGASVAHSVCVCQRLSLLNLCASAFT